MTNHYFIAAHSDGTGDNLDLLVEANSVEEALALWIDYYELDEGEAELDRVWLVPKLIGESGVCAWGGDEPTSMVGVTP